MSSKRKTEYGEIEQEIDIEEFRDSVIAYFSNIPDPRADGRSFYKLEHLFFIILAATLAGANSINQISVFAQVKAKWIKTLIGIERIPTYGAFWWVLARVRPEFLRELLKGWIQALPYDLRDQVLAIDGKCLRGTQSTNTINSALHLVSLFSTDTGLILAQQPVEEKSNEITAIPKILEGVDIRGATITIDAMGCQRTIAKQICDAGADYLLALKGNAGLIYDEVVQYFKEAEKAGYEYLDHTCFTQEDLGHGRKVRITVRCVQDVEWLPQLEHWEQLRSLVEVISERTVKDKTSVERRYYITSSDVDAKRQAGRIRCHWKIENNLHRQLDVNFMEDDSPVNTGYAAENLSTFRRLAINELGSGKGLLERRRTAAWNEEYLTQLLRKFFIKSF